MRYSSYAVCLLAGLFLYACSSASFSGTTPSRARSTTDSITGTSTGTATESSEPETTEPTVGTDPSETPPSEPGDSPLPESDPVTDPTNTDLNTDITTSVETSTATSVVINPKPEPPCIDQTRSIGAKIAFLIDNSQSNELNDCPFPVKTGVNNSSGQPLYRCDLATNREKAVLASFDFLQKIAQAEPNNAVAVSSVAVTSFPATEVDGYRVQSSWRDTMSSERSRLSSLLKFTREPMGQTPYGEALAGAENLFASVAQDERAKIAILITDGLPTDRNPSAAQVKADKLRQSGVRVITVYVTGKAERTQRNSDHRTLLAKFDTVYQASNQHWYDVNSYNSFDGYMQAIFGLASGISKNDVLEVQDAAALEKALLSIISQQAIRCER